MTEEYLYRELTERVIQCSYQVHNELGAGFLEKVYQNALAVQMREADISFKQEHPLSVFYRNQLVGEYVSDFVIEDKVIVELKAVSELSPAHEVQLVNYLKAIGLRVRLVINFGKSVVVKRRIL